MYYRRIRELRSTTPRYLAVLKVLEGTPSGLGRESPELLGSELHGSADGALER
jgi:hypothetical protein